MTDEQLKLVANFEARVRQLMFVCDKLKKENVELKDQVSDCRKSYDLLSEEYKKLNVKYESLKMVRVISVKQGDFAGAKNRFSDLVRKVDECISLLNV
ncbi:hypothetical protein FACS1894123_00960 [Bacteroidia bacterium]|nr:hypothetical protein FACS1894123_00960 [Bacteroidia bacterium]